MNLMAEFVLVIAFFLANAGLDPSGFFGRDSVLSLITQPP